MLAAHIALLALIGLTPIIQFLDGWLMIGVIALYTVPCLAMIVVSIRPGEAGHWVTTMRWAIVLAALPCAWLLIQLLPLPMGGISRSVWQSADAALNSSLWPRPTIDPGLTLLAFCQYLTTIGIGFVAAAVSIDRQQAEKVLLTLGGATLVISMTLIAGRLGGFAFFEDPHGIRAPATAVSGYGVILIAAIIIMMVDRYFTRSRQDFRSQLLVPLACSVAALVICAFALVVAAIPQAIFAGACGFATVALTYVIRRVGLGRRAGVAIAGVAIIAAVFVVSTGANPTRLDVSVRYASDAYADRASVTNRLVGEVGIGGSGAGTYAAIQRLYATEAVPVTGALPPTFAAQVAVELGRPALWIIAASAIVLIVLCVSGGFNRGRDFFYSIAAAGVAVTTLILAFCDIGIANPATSILLVSTLGLGLVQAVGRNI